MAAASSDLGLENAAGASFFWFVANNPDFLKSHFLEKFGFRLCLLSSKVSVSRDYDPPTFHLFVRQRFGHESLLQTLNDIDGLLQLVVDHHAFLEVGRDEPHAPLDHGDLDLPFIFFSLLLQRLEAELVPQKVPEFSLDGDDPKFRRLLCSVNEMMLNHVERSLDTFEPFVVDEQLVHLELGHIGPSARIARSCKLMNMK